ncbi:DUF4260 domain-containing protein [Maribellus sp. CM-23]|uniref:DUF4260 domain-containing protein n=1 Tax=Maribellus sp. CM-23 TaxID=2781026 RepID=UPI001F195922|nr:DUF4260 domain-containing protein [Maribellus sp. CM-23]MCE4564587.1 DUF4260 domain-containing protein [Maribellus sp. CM-23]
MKLFLKIEEISMLYLSFYVSLLLGYDWWVFTLFLFTPDISMLGYILGRKTGAVIYNIFHYKFLAVLIGVTGYATSIKELAFAGAILFGHSSFDRLFGYGLKYSKGFKFTHLGAIGSNNENRNN